MRIRLLDRYVAREFLRLFFLFLFAMPLFISLMDLIDNLDDYQGMPPAVVAMSYVYQMPTFMSWAFPVAALIATIFTVNNLTRHSEVTAAKNGGISFHRMFAPIPILGIFLTGLALALVEAAPVANRKRAELVGERRRTQTSRSDFVYRAQDGSVYSIQWLDAERGYISQIVVEREGGGPAGMGMHVHAGFAEYYPEVGSWVLNNGNLRLFKGEGEETAFRFDRLQLNGFRETPEQLVAQPKDPTEMRYAELGEFIAMAERSGGRPLKLKVEQAQKIAIPVATLIIILFAAPLANSSPRGGTAYGIGISLGITIIYLMLFKIAGAAGASGAMNPLLAAWLPNGVFALAALVLIARVRT